MTSRQRAARDLRVFEAREQGAGWDEVAASAGISARHARRIYASFEDDEGPLKRDPVVVVEELYLRYEDAYERLGEILEEATHDAAKVGAIRARLDVANSQVNLLQAVGAVPSNLGQLKPEIDLPWVLERIGTVFERHAVPRECLLELAEVLSARSPEEKARLER